MNQSLSHNHFAEITDRCIQEYPNYDMRLYRKPRNVLASFLKTDLMSPEPNSNSDLERAIAVQISSLAYYMMAVLPIEESDNFMVKAVALRTLVENSSNIAYMIVNKHDKSLPTKFLETTHATAEMLYAIKYDKPVMAKYWTSTKITQRIKLLDEIASDTGMIVSFYSFLSSFTHADAGYLSAYTHGYRDTIDEMFKLLTELCMEGLFQALVSDGAIKDSDVEKIIEARFRLASGEKYEPRSFAR